MQARNIIHIVGARPNFMKLAPVYNALASYAGIHQYIIHTGQHYDPNMSDIFFEQFNIPAPDLNLNIRGEGALSQIGNGILKLEEVLPGFRPHLVIIYGDINATACAAIVCSKLGIRLAHVEAGLRSFDRSMPEETNRIIADSLSDYFFTPSADANANLLREGVDDKNIFLVGNVMIDTLIKFLPEAEKISFSFKTPSEYGLVTLHRPSNVDDKKNLRKIIAGLEEIAKTCPIIFPMHPRTRSKIAGHNFSKDNILVIEPLSYLHFLKLQNSARFIITDSGGIQEESTYLGIPCFTLRANTERPITIETGTNTLVGTEIPNLIYAMNEFFSGARKKTFIPEFWDGEAGKRIAKIVNEIIYKPNSG